MTAPAITSWEEFLRWLATGDTPLCIYHKGLLGDAPPAIRNLAGLIWQAAVERKVYLLQRRKGEGIVEYLAVKAVDGKVPPQWAPEMRVDHELHA
jgi:hypothetical protein